MKIKRILQPGQAGTKSLLEKYGDNLICVRYRYDDARHMMFKTIEIVVKRKSWQPQRKKITNNQIMSLRIAYDDLEARKQVKASGGKWDPQRQVWQLGYEKVIELGMVNRLVNDEAKNGTR